MIATRGGKLLSAQMAVEKAKSEVKKALEHPEEIRQGLKDPTVFLFYRAAGSRRSICAVVKRLDRDGFLLTAYPTDSIKEGDRVWPR